MRNPYGDLTAENLDSLIQDAKAGNERATRILAGIAQGALHGCWPMPKEVGGYLAGVLCRVRDGVPLKLAFSPLGRVPPEITRERRKFGDMALVLAVDKGLKRGLKTSKDGDPGPVFERVARSFGLSPSSVRDRYYKCRDQVYTRWGASPWSDVVQRHHE